MCDFNSLGVVFQFDVIINFHCALSGMECGKVKLSTMTKRNEPLKWVAAYYVPDWIPRFLWGRCLYERCI